VFWVMVTVVAVIVFLAAAAAAGRTDRMSPPTIDRPPLDLPADRALQAADVEALRLSVAFRGYRMDEVDDVLDRLRDELAARDARIGDLERQLGAAVNYIRSMQQRS
jgi:DivIVA domain-containing protein